MIVIYIRAVRGQVALRVVVHMKQNGWCVVAKMNTQGTAVVTGASAGIGAVYARRLAHRGYDLVLVARNEARLKTLAAEITVDTGRSVQVLVADLATREGVDRVSSLLRDDARVSLLVNNAGTAKLGPLTAASETDIDSTIDLNITALTHLTQAVLPGFVARRRGGIINIASILSFVPMEGTAVYGGTKAYVLYFTRSLAQQVAGQGIQVQAVLPGLITTELWDESGVDVRTFPKEMTMTPDQLVDAALAGWDSGELFTLPSLEEISYWNDFESAREALAPLISRDRAASRYLQPAGAQS